MKLLLCIFVHNFIKLNNSEHLTLKKYLNNVLFV